MNKLKCTILFASLFISCFAKAAVDIKIEDRTTFGSHMINIFEYKEAKRLVDLMKFKSMRLDELLNFIKRNKFAQIDGNCFFIEKKGDFIKSDRKGKGVIFEDIQKKYKKPVLIVISKKDPGKSFSYLNLFSWIKRAGIVFKKLEGGFFYPAMTMKIEVKDRPLGGGVLKGISHIYKVSYNLKGVDKKDNKKINKIFNTELEIYREMKEGRSGFENKYKGKDKKLKTMFKKWIEALRKMIEKYSKEKKKSKELLSSIEALKNFKAKLEYAYAAYK